VKHDENFPCGRLSLAADCFDWNSVLMILSILDCLSWSWKGMPPVIDKGRNHYPNSAWDRQWLLDIFHVDWLQMICLSMRQLGTTFEAVCGIRVSILSACLIMFLFLFVNINTSMKCIGSTHEGTPAVLMKTTCSPSID
jgi:hypothetical protein